MKALTRFRAVALALGVVLAVGCSTDEASSPTQPPPNPVPPPVGINVSVTASNSSLEVDSTTPSIITIQATRADNGAPVPNLTQATVTTTLGGFGSVGGPQQTTVELINGQGQVTLFPGSTIGTATIRATVSGGVGLASVNVHERGTGGAFFISGVTPNVGSPQGGDLVVISGQGFSDPIRVTIGGNQATIQHASETQIRVTTPPCSFNQGNTGCFAPGASTPADVRVIVNLNTPDQAEDTLAGGFVYQAGGGGGGNLQPVVYSVTPSSGPNSGGNQVTINGDGFDAPVEVLFGPAPAQVLSVTRSRVVVVAPPASGIGLPNLNSAVDIRVTNQLTGRTTTAQQAYRFGVELHLYSIAPSTGPLTGGTLVTLFGAGFDSPVAIGFEGSGCPAPNQVSVSGSEIVIRTAPATQTSCSAISCSISVTNLESGDSTPESATFTYESQAPVITGISPATGGQGGGTHVTITGLNFVAPLTVSFGGNAGTVNSVSSSSVSATTPPFPTSIFGQESCDDNGDGTIGQRYVSNNVNVTLTNPVSSCTSTLPGAFRVTPSDTSCRGDVAPPPPPAPGG